MEEINHNIVNTLEEICFLAKYLLKDEELENDLIIALYRFNKKSLGKEYYEKQIENDFINLLMKEGKLCSRNVLDESLYIKKGNISDKIIDVIIREHLWQQRKVYKIDKDRLSYLFQEIEK